MYTSVQPKISVLINLIFLFVHNHSTKVTSHSYSLIYSFLHCADILLYSRQCFPYISFALFLAVLPLYFIRSIHSSTSLMFPTLYSWKCCSYILYAISMAIWNLSLKDAARKRFWKRSLIFEDSKMAAWTCSVLLARKAGFLFPK